MKKNILYILLDSVFLILFNTIFFVAGGNEHPASVWISYAFIHFAYIMLLITPLLIRKCSSAAVFGFSLHSISYFYFFAEFVAGLIFIFAKGESYKPSLLTQIVIAGIYIILLIVNMIANENTADSIDRHERELVFIKESSSRVKLLIGKLSDKKADKELEKLYDLIHSSPARSSESVQNIEITIVNRIIDLEYAVRSDDNENTINICKKIISLVEERNAILKSSY